MLKLLLWTIIDLLKLGGGGEVSLLITYLKKSDSHETWKCADPELERQIHCFPYGERSDVPRLQQVEQKADGRQRNLGLLGAVPVEMVIERNMLSTLMNIARNKLSVEYHILSHELAMKNENGKIFINRIQEILEKYGLGKVEEYLHIPKAKEVWKIIVKKHQNKFWKETCKEDQKNKKTLK